MKPPEHEDQRRHPEARQVWGPPAPYLRRMQVRSMDTLIANVRHTKGEHL